MKKYLTFFTIVLFLTLIAIPSPTYAQWQKNIIDDDFPGTIVSIADMDRDNDMDVVVTSESTDKLFLYENNYPSWTKHLLDANLPGAFCVYFGDIDIDGNMDVVASGAQADIIYWYENNHPVWTRHFLASFNSGGYLNVFDIDGDDTLDVTTGGYYNGDISWFENNQTTWPEHIIESQWGDGVTSLQVGDIDGDENLDVTVVGYDADRVAWFKNENAGLSWTEYTIDDNLDGVWHQYIGDIDGDGDMDVAAGGRIADVVVWYENNHPTWNKHIIANMDGAYAVCVADIDGDEKQDVIAGKRTSNGKIVWYKNNLPDPWEMNVIGASLDRPNSILTGDIDGDNILDLVVALEGGGKVLWYKNPHTTVAFGETVEVYPKYIAPQQGDTLKVIAEISNPENHQLLVHAFIEGNNYTFKDSLQLFDDGLHGDGSASDNIFGEVKLLNELDEDYFDIKLRTTDINESYTTYCLKEGHFTTAGPLLVDNYEISEQSANSFRLQYSLRNDGSTNTATAVTAVVSTTDTNVTNTQGTLGFGNIAPGQVKSTSFGLRYNTQNNPSSIEFNVRIFSSGNYFWSDSITVDIPPLVSVKDVASSIPAEFELYQSYPNPFNPTTTIKYQLPDQVWNDNVNVSLKVYDILGRAVATLVNKKQKPGYYEISWDAKNNSSGIYFYKIQAGKFVKTKKLVVLK